MAIGILTERFLISGLYLSLFFLTDHYDCILDWMKRDHDDCPQCRQKLWKTETFEKLAAQYPPDSEPETPLAPRTADQRRSTAVMLWMLALLIITLSVLVWFFLFHWEGNKRYMENFNNRDRPSSTASYGSEERAADILKYVNSITLTGRALEYPSDSSPEEKAVAFLIDSSELGVQSERARFFLTQKYVVLAHLFQKYETIPEDSFNTFVEDFDSCSTDGVVLKSLQVECKLQKQNFTDLFVTYAETITTLKLLVPLREEIGLLTSLVSLETLTETGSASIPSSMRRLTDLETLKATGLSGSIPDFVDSWKHLRVFDAQEGSLTGTLPASMSQWTFLGTFDVTNNELAGTLPFWVENWKRMRYFSVENNQFTGTLPDVFTSWDGPSTFSVKGNQFSGSVPVVETLSTFDVSGNDFTGSLTNDLCPFITKTARLAADCDEVDCDCCKICCFGPDPCI